MQQTAAQSMALPPTVAQPTSLPPSAVQPTGRRTTCSTSTSTAGSRALPIGARPAVTTKQLPPVACQPPRPCHGTTGPGEQGHCLHRHCPFPDRHSRLRRLVRWVVGSRRRTSSQARRTARDCRAIALSLTPPPAAAPAASALRQSARRSRAAADGGRIAAAAAAATAAAAAAAAAASADRRCPQQQPRVSDLKFKKLAPCPRVRARWCNRAAVCVCEHGYARMHGGAVGFKAGMSTAPGRANLETRGGVGAAARAVAAVIREPCQASGSHVGHAGAMPGTPTRRNHHGERVRPSKSLHEDFLIINRTLQGGDIGSWQRHATSPKIIRARPPSKAWS
eukprot:364357-Chlamydomonas_euryale.AAC.4